MARWATQAEYDHEFRMRTLSHAEAKRRGLVRAKPGPLDPASIAAAHGLSRPERTLTGQPSLCPECGYGGDRHAAICPRSRPAA